MVFSINREGVMAEEEKGFVIRDRRNRGAESDDRSGAASSETSAGKASEQEKSEETAYDERLPPSFLSFVYSLGTSALMLLGEGPGQEGASTAQSLGHAQEIIDLLTILETKTKGNLTQEEETLLQEMLYALRIKYVEKASSQKS
jgi:hypothetical protein